MEYKPEYRIFDRLRGDLTNDNNKVTRYTRIRPRRLPVGM